MVFSSVEGQHPPLRGVPAPIGRCVFQCGIDVRPSRRVGRRPVTADQNRRLFNPPTFEKAGIGSVLLYVGGFPLLCGIFNFAMTFRSVPYRIGAGLWTLLALIGGWDRWHMTAHC